MCNISKNIKSHVLWIFKKNVKKHKKLNHLITQPLLLNHRKSVPVSQGHQHQISCSEVWTQETMQLRTVCDKCLLVPITYGILFVTFSFLGNVISKNVKSHVFLNSEKKPKIPILEHCLQLTVYLYSQHIGYKITNPRLKTQHLGSASRFTGITACRHEITQVLAAHKGRQQNSYCYRLPYTR